MAEREEKPFESSHYDREYFTGHLLRYKGPVYSQRVKNVKRFLGEVRGKQVLDLGCGVGFFSDMCRAAGAQVSSMDFSMEALRFCREEYEGSLRLVQADAAHLPFPDAAFDVVIMNDIIEHLTARMGRAMLEETHRVLRQGGCCVLDTDNERYLMNRPGFRRINDILQKNTVQQKALHEIKKVNQAPSLHVKIYDILELKALFTELGFQVEAYDTYPYIAAPLRDRFFNFPLLSILFKRVKGDVQIFRCRKR
jgi:ubiquinone/menaquinone biosynthesis C-methylase UbiE